MITVISFRFIVFYLTPSSVRNSTMLCSSLLYSTLLYSSLLYSTLLYSTLLYSTLLYSTLLYSTVPHTHHTYTHHASLAHFLQTALTSESILNIITRAFSSTATAVLICQAFLVICTSFGGGVFITWNRTPYYWRWLQEISVFTQASRAIISNINNRMVYRCPILLLPPPLNVCAPIGFVVDCDIAPQKFNEPFCLVSGRGMLHGIQGTSETNSPWIAFGYLFLIFVVARLGVLFLMYYPSDRISAAVRAFFSTGVQDQIIQVQQRNRCIEGTQTVLATYLYSH